MYYHLDLDKFQLISSPAVRLYHDNVLAKQAGCGRTPWHYDDHHFPLDTNDVVTAWVPAQPTPLEMGPLAYPLDVQVGECYNLKKPLAMIGSI